MNPRVTLFVFAYNQDEFIAEACHAALAQDYSPLEIIFSDDSSSDDTFRRLSEVADSYTGEHDVHVNKNPTNLGLIGHVNRCFELSTGDLIVFAGGDDISHPDRVAKLVEAYTRSSTANCLLHSSATMITATGDKQGVLTPPLAEQDLPIESIAECFALYIGATGAVSRSLMDRFGKLAFPKAYEDLVFAFRAVLVGQIHYVDEPLVDYRIGMGLTSQHIKTNRRRSREYRLGRVQMQIDVLQQRLKDLHTIGDYADDRRLAIRIANRMEDLHNREAFLQGPRAFLRRLSWRKSGRMIRAAVSEAQALAKGK